MPMPWIFRHATKDWRAFLADARERPDMPAGNTAHRAVQKAPIALRHRLAPTGDKTPRAHCDLTPDHASAAAATTPIRRPDMGDFSRVPATLPLGGADSRTASATSATDPERQIV